MKDAANYFSLHGTVPNRMVAADSHLCEDLFQHLVLKCQNVRGEVEIPADFENFNGFDGLAVRTFNGIPFCIRFGSVFDHAMVKFTLKYIAYQEKRESGDPSSDQELVFTILADFMKQFTAIANAIVWEHVWKTSPQAGVLQQTRPADQLTLLAFGECGSGKSTFLSLIARIYCKHSIGAKGEKPVEFLSAKSATAVTTKVKI